MKKTRRFAATIAAMALAATMAAPGVLMSIRATDVSIKTDADNATSHTYKAYQIFTGTYDAKLGLNITGYGEGYNGAGLAADAAFKALVITPADDTAAPPVAAVTVGDFLGENADAASVAQAIEKLNYTDGTPEADNLAKILQKYIGGTATATLSNTATDLAAGYWIVVDSYSPKEDETSDNNKPDAVSKYLLRVSGGSDAIEITPKKSYPTVEKKVKENVKSVDGKPVNDPETTEKWNDVADYNINDAVPFKLYGTLPSTYADYEHYYYCFTDTLGSQFNAPAVDDITVKVNGESISNPEGKTNMRVSVDGQTITISFEDIKAFAANATDVITVEYSAVLNETAVIGLDGQENKVDLEYSNNPNFAYNPNTNDTTEDKPKDDKGTPDDTSDDEEITDKTPEDKVIVFTYEQDIKKVDAATGAPLEGAVFNLYKKVSEDVEGTATDVPYFVKVDANNRVIGWTKTVSEASELTTGADGICKVIGLDDGTYYLTEKTAPEGYNKINDEMTLNINATTENNQTWNGAAGSALTNIALTASAESIITDISDQLTGTAATNKGTVMAQVKNEKGIHLPSTGGMGTKLFIAGGGITATLAAVYLVSKKRSRKEEE